MSKKANKKSPSNDGFSFNIKSGDLEFLFSGPKAASIGIIYDVAHRLLLEIASIASKRAEDMVIKDGEADPVKKDDEVIDLKKV